jgi:RNA recognition motif-containing protein
MDSEAEALTAMNTKQEAHIGERFIKLEIISYKEYQTFNYGLKGKSLAGCFVSSIGEKITEENKTKCLLIKGLPFKIQVREIVKFFEDYGAISPDNVFVEESAPGRKTGLGLVVFETEELS